MRSVRVVIRGRSHAKPCSCMLSLSYTRSSSYSCRAYSSSSSNPLILKGTSRVASGPHGLRACRDSAQARPTHRVLWDTKQTLALASISDEAPSQKTGGGVHEAGRGRGYGGVQYLVRRRCRFKSQRRGLTGAWRRYGKYASVGRAKYEGRGKGDVAEQRCVTATDTGRTRGDENPAANICYLYAQGRCHLVRCIRVPSGDSRCPYSLALSRHSRARSAHTSTAYLTTPSMLA